MIENLSKLKGETLSQFLQSYATYHGSNKLKTDLIEKVLNLEKYDLEYSQAFIICHAM